MRKDFKINDFFPLKIGDRIPQYINGKKSSGKWGQIYHKTERKLIKSVKIVSEHSPLHFKTCSAHEQKKYCANEHVTPNISSSHK